MTRRQRPRYPEIWVYFLDDPADTPGLTVKTTRAMRREGVSNEEIDAYWDEIDAGGDPFEVTRRWVTLVVPG